MPSSLIDLENFIGLWLLVTEILNKMCLQDYTFESLQFPLEATLDIDMYLHFAILFLDTLYII